MDEDDKMSIMSDDTEEIEHRDCRQRLCGFIVHVSISIFVVLCCAGALVWSFENGEKGSDNGVHHRDASKNFSIFVNEYSSKEGVYSITYRVPDGPGGSISEPQVYPSFWYQDNTNQRLVHKVNQHVTIYAFKSSSFWVRTDNKEVVTSCRYDKTMNYTYYIDTRGLTTLTREHSAFESTFHHQKVFIYEGDPENVIYADVIQDSFLVTSYADAETGALLGWDTYFTSTDESKVYEISYWYDSMTPAMPPNEWFDPPQQCQPSG